MYSHHLSTIALLFLSIRENYLFHILLINSIKSILSIDSFKKCSCFKNNLVRLRKSVLDGLKEKNRLRRKVNDEKQCKRKNVADENMLSNEKKTRQKKMVKH